MSTTSWTVKIFFFFLSPNCLFFLPFFYLNLFFMFTLYFFWVGYSMPKSKLTVQDLAKSQHFEHFKPRISQFQALKESSEHLVLGFLKSFRSDLYWFWFFWRCLHLDRLAEFRALILLLLDILIQELAGVSSCTINTTQNRWKKQYFLLGPSD